MGPSRPSSSRSKGSTPISKTRSSKSSPQMSAMSARETWKPHATAKEYYYSSTPSSIVGFFLKDFNVDSMQKLVQSLKIATVSDSIIYSLLDNVPIFGIPKIQLKTKASEFMPIVNAPVTVSTADVLKADFWNSK